MTMMLLQLALLAAIAFILGYVLGRLLQPAALAEHSPAAGEEIARSGREEAPQAIAEAAQPALTIPAPPPPPRLKPAAAKSPSARPAAERSGGAAVSAKPKPAARPEKAAAKPILATIPERPEPAKAPGGATGKPAARRPERDAPLSSTAASAATDVTIEKPPVLTAPRGGTGDGLTEIGGIGPALERKLNALGIHHFDQIAAWTPAHAAWIGNELGFPGRPERESWIEEAKALVK
ncbi:MAG: hypothetical protein KDJ80_07425 [Nitratireductor sp.]|nr:hypothetical protein [Nitratireductor sp.]